MPSLNGFSAPVAPGRRRPGVAAALRCGAALAVALAALAGPPASAPAQGAEQVRREGAADNAFAARLPAPASVTRELALPEGRLRYVAAAGALPLYDNNGRLQAEVGYVAYTLAPDGAQPPHRRPVTFVVNGGPGASSAWLNFGGLGPRVVAFGNPGDTPSTAPLLEDNPDTWLAFTDLVFIDPPGTGFSRMDQQEQTRRRLWSVDGDIAALARFISRYLTEHGRMTSPKYLVGESYGGFRVPKLAHALQTSAGVGVNGVVMLSPVLDFARLGPDADAVIGYAALLPSMAAAKLEREGRLTPEALAGAEAYAAGDMVLDLLRGPADAAARERLAAGVARFTGLDPELARRYGGRVDARAFAREFRRAAGETASLYDAGVTGPDPWPFDPDRRVDDPVLEGAQAALSSAAVDEITRGIGWKAEGPYRLLSDQVNRNWNWGRGLRPPEALSALQAARALDPRMKILVAHGYGDLVTPYFQSRLDLARLPPLAGAEPLLFRTYPGGHMFYTRESSRRAFRDDARALYDRRDAQNRAPQPPAAAPGAQSPETQSPQSPSQKPR
ncbi:S10 family peptidase [Camelimonas abortus]